MKSLSKSTYKSWELLKVHLLLWDNDPRRRVFDVRCDRKDFGCLDNCDDFSGFIVKLEVCDRHHDDLEERDEDDC